MSNSNRDINAELRKAALEGNIEKVKSLISEGADVNATSELKETPLHWAARRGNQKVVEVLLNNGANVNAVDGNEKTPLHRAAENGHKEVVEALLRANADVNKEEKLFGYTPLHSAAKKDSKEVVEVLLNNGANVNAVNRNGETPLNLATNEEIKTLLQPAKKSDDGLGGKSPESNEGNPGENAGTQQKEKQEGNAQPESDIIGQDSDNTEPQPDNNKEEEQTSTTSAGQGTGVNHEHPAPVEPSTPTQNNGGQITTTSTEKEIQTSNNSTVSIKEEGKIYDKSKYFSGSTILDQDKLTDIFINSHCFLNGGERTQLAKNIHQIKQIFSKYTDNNIDSVWIDVFDLTELDTDEFKKRGIQENHWKNSIHVKFGDVQDKVLVYSWLDIYQFSQDKWNNFLSQLEEDHKVDFIGTGPLTFKYKDFNYRVYPPLFGSSDDKKSFLNDTEVFSFSRTEVSQIIENIKRSHQSIKKQVIDHYALLNKDFVENDVDSVKIITDVNNKIKLTSIRYSNTSKDITLESEIKYETTPLHTLAKLGDKLLPDVKALLAKGADVNTMDKNEKTPLHYAAKNGHVKIVQVLLKADGINVNAVDEDGKTPLDLATDDKIKTLLENAKEPDDGLGGKSPESNEEESKVSEDTDQKTQIVDGGTPQNNEGDPGKEKQGGDIQPETGVKAEGVKPVAPTEPAQTEEQPSSFFGSLFSILMKPFSLVASFFGSFFSWLFGSDEPTQSSSESDQPVVLESPSSSEDNDII